MQKKLFVNIILLLAVNLLVKPFWILGIDRGFQNAAGTEVYGTYFILFNLSMLFSMLLDFGINNYNSSTIATQPEKLSEQFSQLISLRMLLSLGYLLITLGFAAVYDSKVSLALVLLLALNQILAYLSTFVRSCITGIQLFRIDAFLSAGDRFTMILLGIPMLAGYLFDLSVFSFILIQTIGYCAVLTTGILILRPHLQFFRLQFNLVLLKELFRKTLPYALLAFIMLLYTSASGLLMNKLLDNGVYMNGIYASGGRLLDAANMMMAATAVLLLPAFARMLSNGDDLTSISRLLSTFMLLPGALFALFCSVYSNEIMTLLAPGSPAYTARVFSYLILCFIPTSFMYTYGSMLTAGAEMRILNLVCFTALVVNLVINLVLIPTLGAEGAAISAVFTHSIVGFGKFFFAIRKMKLQHPPAYYLKLFGFFAVAFFLLYSIHQAGFGLISGLAAGLAFCAGWAIVFRMVNLRQEWALAAQIFRPNKP